VVGIKKFYQAHRWPVRLIIMAIPILLLVIGYLVAPELVWDKFIWKYYVAPIQADAQDHPIDGITESYNPVDTLTYGLVLVLSILCIYKLLKWLKVDPGRGMFYGAIPYILLGGVLRSLEDAGWFTGKLVYLAIAPMIYIFIGLVTVLKLVEAHNIEKEDQKGPQGRMRALATFAIIHVIWNSLYLIGYHFFKNGRELFSTEVRNFAYLINPAVSVMLSVCAFMALCILVKRNGKVRTHDVFAVFGWHFFALAAFHAMAFMMNEGRWPNTSMGTVQTLELAELALVPLLALIVTAIFVGICHGLSHRARWLRIYWKEKMNVLIMYGHMFDAAATFTALQWHNYGEKHVVPNAFINITGTPAVMFPLKIITIGFVLYVLNVYLKSDLKRKHLLRILIWIALLVLGLAPGTRDIMRLVMGV